MLTQLPAHVTVQGCKHKGASERNLNIEGNMYVCVGVTILFGDTKISKVEHVEGILQMSQNIGRLYIMVNIMG